MKGLFLKHRMKKKKVVPIVAAFTIAALIPAMVAGVLNIVCYASEPIQTDIPRLYEAYQNISTHPDAAAGFGYGGMGGVCIGPDALNDTNRMDLVKYHFDNITIENQLKQDHILPSYVPNTDAPDGNGGYFPTLSFEAAKPILDWVKEYNATNAPTDADIKLRGHVLVWHSQAREWFFRENYQAGGLYVSPDVMNQRLEYYIKSVFEYFEQNGYSDLFYGYDVVNEAVSDGGDGYRKSGVWWNVYQDESFIINAFKYANQYAPAHIKLFYNDYNDTVSSKVEDIVALIEAVKAQEGAPGEGTRIDGMGMQGHYDMVTPTPGQFKDAAIAYQQALGEGGEIQVTELDMKATNGFTGGSDPVLMQEENDKQGWHYAELYNAIRELVADGSANITNIIFWGTHDRISWLKNSNTVGGSGSGAQVFPLLFDDYMQAKPAYWAFVNQQMLAPTIRPVTVLRSDEVNYDVAQTYEFGDVTFAPIWNEKGLYLKATVRDIVTNDTDQISLYVDGGTLWSQTVKRSEATAVAGGYEVEFQVDIPNLEILSTFRLDMTQINDGVLTSFNDPTNTQSEGSKNYALATCKPFAMIPMGTPTLDGVEDAVWANVQAIPFTIVTDSPDQKTQASAKLLWDENNLYVLATVTDSTLDKSGANGGVHLQDSVEVFIDEWNHKADGYAADDSQYRINFDNEATFNGENANAERLTSVTTKTDTGYIVEAAFQWIRIEPKAGQKIGLELQINDAKFGNRIGCLSWFDDSGNGWTSPKVFGTAMLTDAPENVAQIEESTSSTQELQTTQASSTEQDSSNKEASQRMKTVAVVIISIVVLCVIVLGGVLVIKKKR
ncbi:MAG: endo-1,4-beta-xylanase [Lachnospiraceae bacterium]|jgi:endo-1,4-beta-xylanase|nr:endo-1,4-beta-xylanase [Lachnospiraceae bacterium]